MSMGDPAEAEGALRGLRKTPATTIVEVLRASHKWLGATLGPVFHKHSVQLTHPQKGCSMEVSSSQSFDHAQSILIRLPGAVR